MTAFADLVRVRSFDALLKQALTSFYVPEASDSTLVIAGAQLLDAMSRMQYQVIFHEKAVDYTDPVAGNSGPYATHRDLALLRFRCNGGIRIVTVPGPNEGIFKADGRTVNADHTDVSAFITWALAHCTDENGNAFDSYYSGYRDYAQQP